MRFSRDAMQRISDFSCPNSGGCWLWTGTINGNGYGKLFFNGRQVLAHRLSYETFIGPIPKGLFLDHLCRARGCVNPAHLEAVTLGENTRRGDSGKHLAVRVACPQGHEYTPQNTWLYQGRRYCRQCRRDRRATQARKEAAIAAKSRS